MGRVTVLRFPVSRLRTHFGGWSDLRAKPHASAPQRDGGRREDSDHERDQLPPRVISAVLRCNRYQTNRGGDAGTGCCHPLVTAAHNPAREHSQREDRQRSDRVRPLDTEGREHKEDGDQYGHRGDPSHPSIVGRATSSVNPTEPLDAPIACVTKLPFEQHGPQLLDGRRRVVCSERCRDARDRRLHRDAYAAKEARKVERRRWRRRRSRDFQTSSPAPSLPLLATRQGRPRGGSEAFC